jgi:hypothetical protein
MIEHALDYGYHTERRLDCFHLSEVGTAATTSQSVGYRLQLICHLMSVGWRDEALKHRPPSPAAF